MTVSSTTPAILPQMLAAQRAAFTAARPEPLPTRRDGIDRLNSGAGAGVTVVINGGMIGTESFVRDVMIPQLEASLKRRLA